MSNYIKHFMVVEKHRHKVLANCVRSGIPVRGLLHDLTKLSPTEFIPGGKYFQGFRSPNEAEREDKGYSEAWIHHKGINRHHFEHWTDYNPKTKKVEPVPMPDVFIIEMFCDRVAASKTYMKDKYTDSSPLEYYSRGKSRRFIHPETADKIEFLLTMLSEKGETETFRYIRKNRKNLFSQLTNNS